MYSIKKLYFILIVYVNCINLYFDFDFRYGLFFRCLSIIIVIFLRFSFYCTMDFFFFRCLNNWLENFVKIGWREIFVVE